MHNNERRVDAQDRKTQDNLQLNCQVLAADERYTIGEFSRETGVTLRALRFYQSKGLLAGHRNGHERVFTSEDRDRMTLILQGKRLGFILSEIREMLAGGGTGGNHALPISRKKCVEQIKLLEGQRRAIQVALTELRQIYTGMFISPDISRLAAGGALDSEPRAKSA